jgi:hypothetical protein
MENKNILTITPYIYEGNWVFDDPAVNLDKEAFINGADLLIYKLVENIPHATNGFILNFSAMPFDGYSVKLDWLHGDSEGNWYLSEQYQMDGWLCPSLLKYFSKPPKELYVGAEPLPKSLIVKNSQAAQMAEMIENLKLEENISLRDGYKKAQNSAQTESHADLVSPQAPKPKSKFYEQFEKSKSYTLLYPEYKEETHPDGDGPYWLPSGELDLENISEWMPEEVDVVELGGNKYQLADKCDLSFLRLNWGDIFYAEKDGEELTLQKIEMPMPYKHYTSIGSGFSNNTKEAELIHRLNGGWKSFALGCLTVSIPSDKVEEYEYELVKLE